MKCRWVLSVSWEFNFFHFSSTFRKSCDFFFGVKETFFLGRIFTLFHAPHTRIFNTNLTLCDLRELSNNYFVLIIRISQRICKYLSSTREICPFTTPSPPVFLFYYWFFLSSSTFQLLRCFSFSERCGKWNNIPKTPVAMPEHKPKIINESCDDSMWWWICLINFNNIFNLNSFLLFMNS